MSRPLRRPLASASRRGSPPTSLSGPPRAPRSSSGFAAILDDEREIERRIQDWVSRNPAPRGSLSQVADHIDHIREVAGIDHVGIGSDFYDAGGPSMAEGLGDVTRFPALVAELLARGYNDEDAKKIAGGNLLRVMGEAERVSEELRKERDPSIADSRQVRAR